MRVLQAVHYFPPRHIAGTEVYCANLSVELAQRHEVAVFTSEDGPSREPVLETRRERGLRVWQATYSNAMSYPETWRNPAINALFERVLDEFKPDVVHFQHAIRLGAELIETAKRRGIPVVLTLADYWFICPQTQMFLPDGSRCMGPEGGTKCLTCPNALEHIHAPNRDLPQAVPEGARNALLRLAFAIKARMPAAWWNALRGTWGAMRGVRPKSADPHRATVERLAEMKAILKPVDVIIAPSSFLAERYRAEGIGGDRMIVSDYGFSTKGYQRRTGALPEGAPLRFGFVGTLTRHKGVHVLIEAFNGLKAANAELEIYGDLAVNPPYSRELRALARHPRIRFMGGFDNANVGEILSRLDVLVVPSIWWENSPLTIHEAFLAGVPPIVSDIGGMAGLVREGVDGRHFKAGDAASLRSVLVSIVADPAQLARWASAVPPVKSIAEDAAALERIYLGLLDKP